ncbi:MAG TPA: hypothetical protein VEY87_11680 [Gaiellaceae bacterium]|nr:hypothetical protein [Gaiellaceae bacterium]
MSDLELRLAALRDDVVFPATPDLAARVVDLASPRPSRRLRPLVVAVAVAVALAAGLLAASPGARSAFLELFRLKGATVTRVERLPQVDRVELDLGSALSRAEAERRVGFRLLDLGEPDAILVRGRMASLVYGPPDRPRLVLSQLRASVWDGFVKKAGGAGTRIDEVSVGGERGLFLSGVEHYVMFLENGSVRDERTALAGNVLLWNRGDLLLRLEADVGREEALELAESVR